MMPTDSTLETTVMNSYIASGLTALSRNAELNGKRWFIGHIGAAVMAGGFLLENGRISEEARHLLRGQLDEVMAENEPFFVPFEEAPTVPLTRLLAAIEQNCSTLSMSGHGVIYGTLALRALDAFPGMATAALIDGIIPTLESTRQDDPARYYGIEDYREYRPRRMDTDLEVAAQRAYRMSCENIADNQTLAGRYYFFAGEKLHGITHAQALLNLSSLGYPELAARGLANLNKQLELNEQQPEGLEKAGGLSLNVLDQSFWRHKFKDLHSIKLAYSSIELNGAFGDQAIPLMNLAQHFAYLT
jgi:hypothetical protein